VTAVVFEYPHAADPVAGDREQDLQARIATGKVTLRYYRTACMHMMVFPLDSTWG